jgi:hypothetical protein
LLLARHLANGSIIFEMVEAFSSSPPAYRVKKKMDF